MELPFGMSNPKLPLGLNNPIPGGLKGETT